MKIIKLRRTILNEAPTSLRNDAQKRLHTESRFVQYRKEKHTNI
jgi:hypothetical protein